MENSNSFFFFFYRSPAFPLQSVAPPGPSPALVPAPLKTTQVCCSGADTKVLHGLLKGQLVLEPAPLSPTAAAEGFLSLQRCTALLPGRRTADAKSNFQTCSDSVNHLPPDTDYFGSSRPMSTARYARMVPPCSHPAPLQDFQNRFSFKVVEKEEDFRWHQWQLWNVTVKNPLSVFLPEQLQSLVFRHNIQKWCFCSTGRWIRDVHEWLMHLRVSVCRELWARFFSHWG